jgi:hypothetical protein
MMRFICLALIFTPLLLFLPGCADSTDDIKATLNQEFALSIGQSALITGENLQIKFQEVVEDSRCPKGVTCVWQGRVSCKVEIITGGSSDYIVLTQPGLSDEPVEQAYKDYLITFRVKPYPEAGKTIEPVEYQLLLNLSK